MYNSLLTYVINSKLLTNISTWALTSTSAGLYFRQSAISRFVEVGQPTIEDRALAFSAGLVAWVQEHNADPLNAMPRWNVPWDLIMFF